MKTRPSVQFVIMAVAVLACVPVILMMGGPSTQQDKPSVVAAMGLRSATSTPAPTMAPVPETTDAVLGSYEMSLSANTFNVEEADNVRWSLVRRSSEGAKLWVKDDNDNPDDNTNWAAVRGLNMAGSITIPQGVWSFNSIFRAGVGYRRASGILAGGHCALASALKAAADDAGLKTEIDKKHSSPIPGFGAENSVAILWGGSELDLRVLNDTGRDLRFIWSIAGDMLKINVEQAPSDIQGKAEVVRMSWYWPPLGGPNCARFVDGECVSNMASGEPWQDWVNRAVACPKQWPFGTVVRLVDHGVEFTCMDRGGKIVYLGGIAWVDTLTEFPLIAFAANTQAEIIFPE